MFGEDYSQYMAKVPRLYRKSDDLQYLNYPFKAQVILISKLAHIWLLGCYSGLNSVCKVRH